MEGTARRGGFKVGCRSGTFEEKGLSLHDVDV
jgi:hypothetical protein